MNTQVARKLLANMPDEVFAIYIEPLIQAHGWPFTSLEAMPTSPEALRWFQMFDRQSLQTISQLSWEKYVAKFSFEAFHPRSQDIIAALVKWHIGGVNTFAANIADSRVKFFSARSYIEKTGTFPVPVILQRDPLGLRILDGNHRLAAMASFPNSGDGIVDCWIGSL
jgi:hypothetical protein